jgi:hypothetical protein
MWQTSNSAMRNSSRITALETKVLEISGQVSKVLERCSHNAKCIEMLNTIASSFMKQLLSHLKEGLDFKLATTKSVQKVVVESSGQPNTPSNA